MTVADTSPAFFYAWLFMLVVIFTYLVLVFYTFSYLKKRHHAEWVTLGSPSFLNNSILNNFKFLEFLFNRRYLLLNDQKLNRLFIYIWILFIVSSLLFIFSLFGIFWR